MEIATVIGHVWATKKEETLTGSKLMIVRPDSGGDSYDSGGSVSEDYYDPETDSWG